MQSTTEIQLQLLRNAWKLASPEQRKSIEYHSALLKHPLTQEEKQEREVFEKTAETILTKGIPWDHPYWQK